MGTPFIPYTDPKPCLGLTFVHLNSPFDSCLLLKIFFFNLFFFVLSLVFLGDGGGIEGEKD